MIKHLVSFGCSWTFGDELFDPALRKEDRHCSNPDNDEYRKLHSFAGLVAKHYNLDYKCLAFPGSSLRSMMWNLEWWLDETSDKEKSETLIIAGLTSESRQSWYNPYFQDRGPNWGIHRYMHSLWIQGPDDIKDEPYNAEWNKLNKLYMTLSDSDTTQELNYKECVYAFDGAAARYNIPMIQVNVLAQQDNPKLPTLRNQGTSIMEKIILRNKPRVAPLFAPAMHPNEEGHQIISEYLIEEAKSVIINE